MKIKYEVTVADAEEYAAFFALRHKLGRRPFIRGRIAMVLIPFLLLFLYGLTTRTGIWLSPIYLGGTVLVSIGLIPGYTWFMKSYMKEIIRKMYAGGRGKGSIGWQERVLTNAGVEAASRIANGFISWEGVEEVYLLEKYIYIFLGPNLAWIVPKERVTEGDFYDFAEELKRLFEKNRPGMKVETVV